MSRTPLHRPPQGWNSWDCFGTTVTEDEVLANARVLAERLTPAGYDTVVVDIDWSDPTARAHGYQAGAPVELDAHGRPQPAPNRFASARDGAGFGPLAAAVHALGLRFGLHLMRGIPRRAVELDLPVAGTAWTARQVADTTSTCAWHPGYYGFDHSHPGAQAYLDSFAAQLAAWGVDYLKIDDMLAPYHAETIEAWRRALDRAGRPVTFSLSPGTGLSTAHLPHLRAHADLWRVSDDLWDLWDDVAAQFHRLARWAPHQGAGFADADMLPVGRIGVRAERGDPRDSALSGDEQRTLLTLWSMARSPLMIGADLTATDDATIARLASPAVSAVVARSTGGAELVREPLDGGDLVVWGADATDAPVRYAAVFWTGDAPRRHEARLGDLLGAGGPRVHAVRDLWDADRAVTRAVARPGDVLDLELPAHGVRWLALDLEPPLSP